MTTDIKAMCMTKYGAWRLYVAPSTISDLIYGLSMKSILYLTVVGYKSLIIRLIAAKDIEMKNLPSSARDVGTHLFIDPSSVGR